MARLALLLSALLLVLLPLALAEERRLIKIAEEEPATWLTEEEALLLVRVGVNFFDITDTPELEKGAAPRASLAFPAKPSHQSVVNGLLGQIVHERFVADLTYFSQQHLTRYYKSPSGVQSANWLFQQAQEIASNRSDITVSQVSHAGYDQRSVVARIRGRNPTGPAVILGAHQDSINSRDPMGRSPGADDDGSGSMSVLEVFRTLALSGFVPELPIEFHWYAAEEVGLLGSQAIASSYKNKGEPVYAMFNLDMTAYTEPGLAVRVIMDFTNRDLSLFTATVVDEYTSLSWRTHNCGYACSDHASWNRAGYNSASIFEPKTNPRIHTNEDDLPLVNWEQTNQFLRLGLAIVVELSYGA